MVAGHCDLMPEELCKAGKAFSREEEEAAFTLSVVDLIPFNDQMKISLSLLPF